MASKIFPPISPAIPIAKRSSVVSRLPKGTLLKPPRIPNPEPAPGMI